MTHIKRAMATAGTGVVLAASMVGAAGATQYQPHKNYQKNTNNSYNHTVTVDKSKTTTYTVSGDCSAIIQTSVDQNQNNSTSQSNNTNQSNSSQGGGALLGGSNNSDNSNSNTGGNANSSNQSQSANVTFSPDCSTTTVAAGPAVAAPQVQAPKGGVHAGGGASATAASSTGSIAGLLASTGLLGLGVAGRKALLGL